MKPKPKDVEKREPNHFPVEPEMEKRIDHDESGRTPGTEPPKEKRVDDL